VTRPTYSESERQHIVELARRVGSSQAAEQLGMNRTTVASMLSRANALDSTRAMMRPVPDLTDVDMFNGRPIVVSVVPSTWAIERISLPDELATLARLAVATGIANLRIGNAAEAERCAKVMSVCIDKASLLSGQATDRVESVSLTISTSIDALRTLANQGKLDGSTRPELIDATSDLRELPTFSDDVTNDE
jgi:hypothetical protein